MNDIIYLDYSATTPVDKDVLDKYYNDNLKLLGNSNSIHKLGRECNESIERTTGNILLMFGLDNNYEVVYTSGASEANNLAIKGVLQRLEGGRIITTSFEHSSVIAPLGSFQRKGFVVDIVDYDKNGQIDLKKFEELMSDDVRLVTISAVNSEIGILQPLEDIKRIVKKYPNAYLHIDMTQCIGKAKVEFTDIDMFSVSAHKIYGLKGIGALVKRKNIKLESQIQGGKSTTKYRSGTPAHPLIISLGHAIYKSMFHFNENYREVRKIHDYFVNKLKDMKNVKINSNDKCIPHIVNVSFIGYNSKKLVLELEKYNIYISNHSACSSEEEVSTCVYALTGDLSLATSSVRFSLSHLTKVEDIDKVCEVLEKII